MAGDEDCLYLNVYTPQVPSSVGSLSPELCVGAPWPIMFWLHPGLFTNGSSSSKEFGPELLVAKDVVVVTVTYRLGAFGFLSLESSAATGNYGLKDVVAALRWVKKNGGVFGGDVNQITVFGCSAGAAIVQYLQLAPVAKGLFHRAIAQSGSSLNPWALCSNPRARALRLARQLGVTENDLANDEKILEFLRSQPPQAILGATTKMYLPEESDAGLKCMFVPTSEEGFKPDDPYDETFLPEHARYLRQKGRVNDVPLITGVTEVEMLLVDLTSSAESIKAVPEVFAKYDAHLEIALPSEFKKVFPDGSENQKAAVKRLRKVYFNGATVREATRNGYYRLQSDLIINNGVLAEARTYARQSSKPVYVYCFTVKGKINSVLCRFGERFNEMPGPCHGDELNYLWTTQPPMPLIPKLEPQSLEAQTRHRLVTLWTNFAKTGNPTPEGNATLDGIHWPALPTYFNIGVTLSISRAGLFKERVEFWDSLYSELK